MKAVCNEKEQSISESDYSVDFDKQLRPMLQGLSRSPSINIVEKSVDPRVLAHFGKKKLIDAITTPSTMHGTPSFDEDAFYHEHGFNQRFMNQSFCLQPRESH